MKLFENDVAIITGAGDGIGRAIACRFAREGAHLLLVDINEKPLEKTKTMARKEGQRVEHLVIDLSERAQLKSVVPTCVDHFGTINVLVNNAGVSLPASIQHCPQEFLSLTVEVNLVAPILLSKYAALHWARHQIPGRIVNITSINAEQSLGGSAAYSASKGGLKQATKAMAYDLGPLGIRVNAVGPGHTRTGITRPIMASDKSREKYWASLTPLGRMGEPEDIASAATFLASEESSFITGQSIYVEGGRTIWT